MGRGDLRRKAIRNTIENMIEGKEYELSELAQMTVYRNMRNGVTRQVMSNYLRVFRAKGIIEHRSRSYRDRQYRRMINLSFWWKLSPFASFWKNLLSSEVE